MVNRRAADKGMIQLAMRTGAYRYINSDVVYEGEYVSENKLSGMVNLSGERASDTVIGYFAYIETLNGFQRCLYWTREKVISHAKRHSKSYPNSAAWVNSFDEMAKKTVLRNLLSKYGVMSVEFQDALITDHTSDAVDFSLDSQDADMDAGAITADAPAAAPDQVEPDRALSA
jgi:recombination protein RecT